MARDRTIRNYEEKKMKTKQNGCLLSSSRLRYPPNLLIHGLVDMARLQICSMFAHINFRLEHF